MTYSCTVNSSSLSCVSPITPNNNRVSSGSGSYIHERFIERGLLLTALTVIGLITPNSGQSAKQKE